MTDVELAKLIRSAPKRYKVFQIPKRTPGQFRTIAQPAREVKALQYWVIDNFLANLPIHSSATAYRKRVSIADNAYPHLSSRYLLKLEEHVTNLCRDSMSPRLTLNEAKTVRVSKKRSRRVTGLVLANDQRLSLGRDQKRQISASVHHFFKGQLSPEEISKLKGTLAYVNSVEPSFLRRLEAKYGSELLRSRR